MRLVSAKPLVLLASIIAAGCGGERPADVPAELATGYWQVRITLPGGDIETGIEIGRTGEGFRATLINGQERVAIDEVQYSNGELLLRFPAFNNEIRATLEDGRLVGALTLVKRYGRTEVMPFVAAPGGKRAEPAGSKPAEVDLSGRWAVQFHNEDGTVERSVGEFAQRGSRLYGTFLNPTADHRYLSGYVRGNRFHLATFDGAHAFLFSGEADKDVIKAADFWSGTGFHQSWSAVRDADAALPDAYQLTYLNPGYERFEFEFPDLDGRPVTLADERFAGKVVVVQIAGTWCPNCHDEAKLLSLLYKKYRAQGLEVVGLMYEHFEEPETAVRQIRRFRQKFDIQYPTLLAGISDKTEVSKTLPALSALIAFPTTIFIDRRGAVRAIHTGFSGPGTGKHHERLQQEFSKLIAELIGEPQVT